MKNYMTVIICLLQIILMWDHTAAIAQTNWQKYFGNPVLTGGNPREWDENGVLAINVYFDGFTDQMWYTGLNANWVSQLGYATSPNKITWTKYVLNPVLGAGTPGTWEERGIGSPSVIFDNTIYHMWYDGIDNNNTT